MSIAQLKMKAKRALLDGKYKKALEYFEELHKADPGDMRVYVKLAELREKNGDTKGAVRDYLEIANAYAEQGFVVQAIAINKIVLRLDPSQTQVKQRLKELSEERGDDWAISTISPTQGVMAMDITGKDRAKLSFERTPLLSGLSGDGLEAFIDSLQLQNVPADSYIYREGESGNYLYMVAMGSIRLETRDREGRIRIISHLNEGDFFGEHAFMSRGAHSESAVADVDSSVLMIDRRTFDRWIEKYPEIVSTVEDFYRQRVLARVLAIAPVFEGVPPEARMALANRFRLKSFDDEQVIVREGQVGDSFYLIRSGQVKVYTRDMRQQDKNVFLGTMGQGEFFGEVALLTNKPRTATVVADGKVELMELSRMDFNAIVAEYPSVKKVVEAYQKQRVKNTIQALMKRKS